MGKLTPEGAAVQAEMDRQRGCFSTPRWNLNAIAAAAIEASDEVKRLRRKVANIEALVRQTYEDVGAHADERCERYSIEDLLEALEAT